MMGGWLRRPEHDPELGNALRGMEASAAVTDPDELRRRIVEAAGTRLAQLRTHTPQWWEWITAWSRVALPVGLAASLAAGLLVQGGGTILDAYSTDMGSDSTLVMAAFSEPASGRRLTAHLIAPEEDDWLLEQAVSQ